MPLTNHYQRYDDWIAATEPTPVQLKAQRVKSRVLRYRPVVSIVTPVHNVDPALLRRAVDSVMAQSYPRWELCLADDASSHPGIKTTIDDLSAGDPRIKAEFFPEQRGIAVTTNAAAEMATGAYIAFMDHDDELSPQAIYRVIATINADRDADLIYSDEDKLEEGTGQRVEPFFKPSWSPELLTQMNYISHLTVLSRDLFDRIGGLRPGFEGSQDHDLVLRASHEARKVAHIPAVLYHWRKIPGSAAMASDAKDYANESGRKAVAAHMARKGINADVEAPSAGRYRLRHLDEPPMFTTIALANATPEAANKAASHAGHELLLFVSNPSGLPSAGSLKAMACYAMRPDIALVGGVIVDNDGLVTEAGLVADADGSVTRAMTGQPLDRPFYFNLSSAVRECTASSLGLLMIRREMFDKLGGFDASLPSPYAEADLGLKAIEAGFRNICFPEAAAISHLSNPPSDDAAKALIKQRWAHLLSDGDPYFPRGIDPDFTQFRFRA